MNTHMFPQKLVYDDHDERYTINFYENDIFDVLNLCIYNSKVRTLNT